VKRILITGGTGFVGTHLFRLLATAGNVFLLSSGSTTSNVPTHAEHYRADIRNYAEVDAVLREVKPEEIYHLAGITSVETSWANPHATFEVNVVGTCNLFDAALKLPAPPRILNVSTSQVYGNTGEILTESSPVHPDNPYAASKAMAELLLVSFRNTRCTIITSRSFNHTGPGQSPAFVISGMAKQFAEIEAGLSPPILKLGNLNVRRDFTDVRDVVRAYVSLLAKARPGEVYNVSSGSSVLLADIVEKFRAISTNNNVKVDVDPARIRTNEVSNIQGDSAKIRRETGWRPEIPLDTTIFDLLDYWRKKIRDEGAMTETSVSKSAKPQKN
jgi:GDP-4-dehydro-6-deoxy-D-mannose reductase